MSRPSAASLSILPPSQPGVVGVPEELSAAEAKLWKETLESKPADWFGPDSYPVLKEYVRAAAMCDTLATVIANAVASNDGPAIKSALDVRDKEAKRVASLATKLRLTQQSRYTPQAAATADKSVAGRRPWQTAS